jgi:hypothetical protein
MDRGQSEYVEAPVEPKVAYHEPPFTSSGMLALIHGATFFAATEEGALLPPGAPNIGLFHNDTRFLSHYELRTNGQPPALLSCNSTGADLARIGLTVRAGTVPGTNLDLPINTIYIDRELLLGRDRLFDVLTLQNYHDGEVTVTLILWISSRCAGCCGARAAAMRGRGCSARVYASAMRAWMTAYVGPTSALLHRRGQSAKHTRAGRYG